MTDFLEERNKIRLNGEILLTTILWMKSLPISPEKLSDDEKNEQRQNSSSNKCHLPFALLIFVNKGFNQCCMWKINILHN